MRLRFSPITFMLAYCLVYIAALLWDLPAFRYYPLHGQLSWGPTVVKGLGPAMAWYGIMAEAALIARDAVIIDTPARAATSRIVGGFFFAAFCIIHLPSHFYGQGKSRRSGL